jgi:lipid II:glycine glycyltransferase (peptidoglycan interpeptide bridge formation enzyme)
MEFVILDEKEYLSYALKNEFVSIYQLPGWGKLKKENGWDYYFVGVKKKDKICGAAMLLRKKAVLNLYIFYSPRGFLLDYNDIELLKFFNECVIKFVKEHKGLMLKIDPNVIYNVLDKDGNLLNEENHDCYDNLLKVGYKHLGFTKNFETMQPRYLCRYDILDSYEDTLNSFTKSTKKNIIKAEEEGIVTRPINEDEYDLFYSLLKKSAENKHFILRPSWYYKKMYDYLKDYLTYFITYLDVSKYRNYLNNNLRELESKHKEIKDKMSKYANVGSKLNNELDMVEKRIDNVKKEISEAKDIKEDKIYLGALMSVFTGNEGITFMSGTDSAYRKYNMKYSFYNEHLKECIKRKLKYVNYYGISGDLNPNSEFYHIYEIKKGYNPKILELVGEFDYVVNKLKYIEYNVALKVYKLLKK